MGIVMENQAPPERTGTTLKKIKPENALKLKDVNKTSVLQEVARSFEKLIRFFGFSKEPEIKIDFARATDRGQRTYQQDETYAGLTDSGAIVGILADGMGGHVAGEVASMLAKEAVLESLNPLLSKDIEPADIHRALGDSVEAATKKLADHIKKNPQDDGMGTTLIVVVVFKEHLYWVSIGDSPLYLWRRNKCYQINQDHSMGPAIDQMARAGLMTKEEALAHPDRDALTSAVNGAKPDLIDAGNDAVPLQLGDIVVLSSDGLQILPDKKISRVLYLAQDRDPTYVAAALLNSVKRLDNPEQDNLSVVTIKVDEVPEENEDKDGDDHAESENTANGDASKSDAAKEDAPKDTSASDKQRKSS